MLEASLTIAAMSGTILVLLIALFYLESRRGGRLVLVGTRSWLDRAVVGVEQWWLAASGVFGAGMVRVLFHYVVHTILSVFAGIFDGIHRGVTRLQQRNRQVAKAIQDEARASHLDSIAEHKRTNALTEQEKAAIKERSLEG